MKVLNVAHTAPDFPVPKGACDCHVHIFGQHEQFPLIASRIYTPGPALPEDLVGLQNVLGLERAVIVQASPQGTDNGCLLDALTRLKTRARGVAVIDDDIDDDALEAMNDAGVRGVRINLESHGAQDPVVAAERLEATAARVARLGWHVQIYASATLLAALADTVANLPCLLVADHFGRVRAADGTRHPLFQSLVALIRTGKLYLKLSAPHRISDEPDYADVGPIVAALVEANPDRMLWGTDWPHSKVPPRDQLDLGKIDPYRPEDDGRTLNLLNKWIPDPLALRKVLVDNPARLYGF